jgi:hypothetical protein
MAWTNPDSHIWTAGEVLTAANMNTYVRLNLDFLYGDTAWIAPTLINSWVNSGGTDVPAGYRGVGTLIILRGVIKLGTLNQPAFVLPAGYRPKTDFSYSVIANSAIGYLAVQAASGNVVPVSGSNAWFSICGITFDNFL